MLLTTVDPVKVIKTDWIVAVMQMLCDERILILLFAFPKEECRSALRGNKVCHMHCRLFMRTYAVDLDRQLQ